MVRAAITKVACFQGAKNGTYYKSASGNRVYLKPARRAAKCLGGPVVMGSANNIRMKGLLRPGRMAAAIERGKTRPCFRGKKGGLFYVNAKGKKTYTTKKPWRCGGSITQQ